LGGRHQRDTLNYLQENDLNLDWRGTDHDYDLVVTGNDLIIPNNIKNKRLVLVQEGITEPETFIYHLVKWLKFPRYLANTAATGLSDEYDIFCVASRGYSDHFVRKGVKPEKVAVTGIPNFDNFKKLEGKGAPFSNYVLVATSPLRETFRYENRKLFLKECYRLADDRQLIFKLHPMEKVNRATREIEKYCPGAIVLENGNVDRMIANADLVITQNSTCTFTAVALGKDMHTFLDVDELRALMPIQNYGASAERIGRICRQVLHTPLPVLKSKGARFRSYPGWESAD
jgi:hypothetical protein